MASINLVSEEEASEKVKQIYDEIKTQLEIDFVPNLYKAMGHNPDYLETNWNRVKTIMVKQGKLDRMTKEIIALTVSAMSGCDY